MKYVEVRRNGGPIQGFGRAWPAIIGAMCLWSSHKRLLGERKDRSLSVSTFTEKTRHRTPFFQTLVYVTYGTSVLQTECGGSFSSQMCCFTLIKGVSMFRGT